ncbi:FAD-binding protein [Roseovarius sp. CAU 1744]|uniref:FAD-binding protein n=1 Tax=Roseovarius sp. CAU 1744 TaxID=3140368 RepID=UPI00325A86A5
MTPASEADLAQVISETDAPLRVQGGGTRPVGAPVEGAVLSTTGLSGIELYEPGALTLVARAGTKLAEVEKVLDAEGQRLAFEPMDHRPLLGTTGAPTIGGVVAANVSGPRRIQVGACRDHLLGVRFVDGQGRIIKNGGRVMKNVTGYDLVKLMAGSFGTLGVLTEVSLKVLPKSHATGVLLLEGLGVADAVKALSVALGSPFEVTGAAHLCKGVDGAPVTMIRLEGFENSVAYRAEKLQGLLADFGTFTLETDPQRTRAGWQYIRDVEALRDHDAVWRVSVKPSDALELLDTMDQMHAYDCVLDWGGGLLWIGAASDQLVHAATYGADGQRENSDEGIRVLHHNLQFNVQSVGGHATLFKAPADLRRTESVFQPLPQAVAGLQAGLRQRFDPRAILNPGLMGQGT